MNDLDLVPFEGGGELAPISAPDLQPVESWTVPSPDFLSEHPSDYYDHPSFFGVPLPDGTSMSQAEQAVNQLTTVFEKDMSRLHFDSWLTDEAVNWFKSNALLPIGPTSPNHCYRLDGYRIPASDRDAVNSFLNHMSRAGAPQRFVQAALWWINQIGQQQPQQHHQRQGQAVTIDDLSDAEFAIVQKRAAKDLANAEAILKQKYGDRYPQVMATVHTYIKNLPAADRQFLETAVAQGGMMLANSPETVVRLYEAAVGQSVKPGNLSTEIQQIENYMRQNRKAYNANIQMQERLRVLYQMRDG